MIVLKRPLLNHGLGTLSNYIRLHLPESSFDGITIQNDEMLFQFVEEPSTEDVEFINGITNNTVLDLLELQRIIMWRKIQHERDRRKSAGVLVGEHWFHSDDSSRIQQLALVMFGPSLPENIMWKTLTGEFVELTPAVVQQIFMASAAQDIAIFSAAETHKAAMLQSVDPESYDYSQGWPETEYTGSVL